MPWLRGLCTGRRVLPRSFLLSGHLLRPVSDRADRILAVAMTIAAVGICAVLVRREFSAQPSGRAVISAARAPEYEPTWQEAAGAGILIGRADAPVKVIEFSDIECPVCRTFDLTLRKVRKKFPNDLAWVFVHYPLAQHRFARRAAHAAECAHRSGHFDAIVGLMYLKQDSLGLKSWASYARDAGLPDTVAFTACLQDRSVLSKVDSGAAVGRRFGVPGTPTVLVNGWRYSAPPSEDELVARVQKLLPTSRTP